MKPSTSFLGQPAIESLEARVAPAAVFTYTDVDGDDVTIKTSKGTNADLAAILTRVPTGLGDELQRIDFSAAPLDGTGKSVFHGTNLTVTAKRTADGGDGRVNVGYIDASTVGGGTALDLGVVAIRGDLGQIDAGDAATATAAVKGLNVQSMGQFGTSTQGVGASLESNLAGALGYLKVAGNIKDAYVHVAGGADAKIGSVVISGSLLGGAGANSGRVFSTGRMGPVSVVGNVEGGSGLSSGSIFSDSPIARVTLGGSIRGGDGVSSGAIYSSANLGPVKITGDIAGGSDFDSGVVGSGGPLAGINLGGSLFGGSATGSGAITSMGAMGAVKIGGSVAGGVGAESGSVESLSTLASLTVVGSLIGGAGNNSGRVYIDGAIGVVKIGGNVQGGAGEYSGRIKTDLTLAAVTVGGALIGGSDDNAGSIHSGGPMAAIKIGGNIEGGSGDESGRISTDSTLARLTVGGSIRGGGGSDSGTAYSDGTMGPVRILGNVEGGDGVDSGRVFSFGTLGSVTLGGSLLGGPVVNSGKIFGDDGIGVITIGGDVRGGAGHETGWISSNGAVAGVTIIGSLIGGSGNQSGGIDCDGALGAVRIDRNIVGGDANGAVTVDDTGFISAQRLASLLVSGSIIAGTESGGGVLANSGAVRVSDDIGPITIKGSLIGNGTNPVLITARGQATPEATTDVAIKSLTVGGRVERADILAGYNTADTPSGVNADAQIGAVVVGDWIASNLAAGVQDDADAARDDSFGDGDDQAVAGGSGGIVSRIASIVIKGTAFGSVGGADFFGFVAQQIGSFKVGATLFPLTPGSANDLAGLLIGAIGDLRVREVAL